MRLAVLSDIHSNLDAFKAVLKDISSQSVHNVVSLGDNIGYGPQPMEIVARLKKYSIPSVMGNHELALLDENYLKTFNPKAKKALNINKKLLTEIAINYVSLFKPSLIKHGCRFVHGMPPDSMTNYIIKESDERIMGIMKRLKQVITFVGHSHQLGIYAFNQSRLEKNLSIKKRVCLANGLKYIINCGSVGQPRDGSNKAKYVIWDSVQNVIEPRFVTYDFRLTIDKMKTAGIPKVYATLLEKASL